MKEEDFELSVSETTESLTSDKGSDMTTSNISSEKPAAGKGSKQLRKHKNSSLAQPIHAALTLKRKSKQQLVRGVKSAILETPPQSDLEKSATQKISDLDDINEEIQERSLSDSEVSEDEKKDVVA